MLYCLLFVLISLFSPLSLGKDSAPIVDLGYAKYQGAFASNISAFRGMRYAAPPVGPLRWREPQLPETVPDVQNATALGPACLQGSGYGMAATNPFTGVDADSSENVDRRAADANSEDGLLLSVFTPGLLDPENVTELLPVVVWIHGGGYIAGSGSDPGDDLVRESGQIVAVTIQYRLAFWFPCCQAVKDHFALQWTNTHISKFGGDPRRVTIWGESAANDGKTSPPLFRGAITSSTFLPSQYSYNDVIPEQLYNDVVDSANCSSAQDTLECLRQVDSTSLENINSALNVAGFFGTFVFVPVVDGTFITQAQRKLNAQPCRKRYWLSRNTDEGGPFVNASTADTVVVSNYLSELFPMLSPENLEGLMAIMNDTIFVCPTYYLLEAFNGHAFKGQYAVPPATHGSDVFYYFPSIGAPDFTNADFVKAFSESFTAFVSSQDPNDTFEPTITPAWDPYATEDGEPLVEEFTTSNSLLERCAFWNTLGDETGQ
ncbi:alpha/beta-hydrolase [Hymenopellis radicata]|nr:alpha/beta-hydrolase [Hymenopellis radicata]